MSKLRGALYLCREKRQSDPEIIKVIYSGVLCEIKARSIMRRHKVISYPQDQQPTPCLLAIEGQGRGWAIDLWITSLSIPVL